MPFSSPIREREARLKLCESANLLCQECGKHIVSSHFRPKKLLRFCSPACWYRHLGSLKVKKKCEVCGAEFKPNYTERTCSQKCGGVLRRKRFGGKCKECGESYWKCNSRGIDSGFCGSACCFKWKHRGAFVTFNCAHCGTERRRRIVRTRPTKKRFCSSRCAKQFMVGQRSPLWRGGANEDRGSEWYSVSRKIRIRDGKVCQVCGCPQKKGDSLSVDHIIPFRVVNENIEVNLLSLCRPCHAVKTSIESRFLRGDILGFKQGLAQAGWNMEKVESAMSYWGNHRGPKGKHA
jgi:HNH endonuclease